MLEKIILISLFFISTLVIGIYCHKKATNVGDFVLGNRNVGAWLTAFAYGTSYFSAVVFVGYAGQFGWNYGISATWIGIGNALIGSLFAWIVLAKRTRIMTKYFDSATMPDFFAKRFKTPALKTVASLIIFVFLIPYSASVYKGLSGLFSMAFGIDFKYCIIGMAVLTAIYVVVGGYMATAFNDLLQGIVMLVGIVMVVLGILNGQGGFSEAISKLSAVSSDSIRQGELTSLFGPQPLNLLSVVILTSLGAWGLPQMIHKFYTIKDNKAIKSGTVISTFFALIIAGASYFMGAFGRLYYKVPESGKVIYDDIVPNMLQSALPNFLIGIVIILVLSASMSTLSSLVITSSSTCTLDFIKNIFFKDMKQKTQIVIIKVLCAAFILVSVLIALNPNSLITALMSLSWGALAGSFLGPFLYGLFWKKTTTASVWTSFGWGMGITALNAIFKITTPTIAGAIAIVGSLLIVPLVSLFTKKMNKNDIDEIFSCYDKKMMQLNLHKDAA